MVLDGKLKTHREMRRLLRNFTLAAAAVLGAVSCTESEIDDDIRPSFEGVTLFATTPSDPSTKVDFTDKGTDGISLEWEAGDAFVLYDSQGAEIDTFTTEDGDGKFTSSRDDLTLLKNTSYTAKFNGEADTAEQNGDEINNLNKACQMEAEFIYGTDDAISFAHTKAIMTFKFESAERPAKLIFQNGDKAYTVSYKELEPDANDIYTSHIMIEPCAATRRTLTFSLYNSEGEVYDIRKIDTSKAHVKGKRYTSPLSNLAPTIWLGSGTQEDPYQIDTADKLRLLATNVNGGESYSGKYFVLTKDLDLKGSEENKWEPIGIGDNSAAFQGVFDGANYTISGLYINGNSNGSSYGLFSTVTDGCTIKNITIEGEVTNTYKIQTAGIAGYAKNATFENCHNKASVNGGEYAGGIVGYSSPYGTNTITNCSNSGDIQSFGDFAGGIAGKIFGKDNNTITTITNCSNSGYISAKDQYVGGLVGANAGGAIYNSYNTGEVKGSSYVGGLAGINEIYNSFSAVIENCYTSAKVSGESNIVGLAIGKNDSATITSCYFDNSQSGSAIGTDDNSQSVEGCSSEMMKSPTLLALLNNVAFNYNKTSPATKAYAWSAGAGNYPTLAVGQEPIYTSTTTSSGSGTESDPYLISSNIQLRDLADDVNNGEKYSGKYFLLTTDIDLGSKANPWVAIGSQYENKFTYFNGIFDGGNHTISGIYINTNSDRNQGFFSRAKDGATIKNLTVEGEITAPNAGNIGGITAFSSESTIANCHNRVKLNGGTGTNVGGIVGQINKSTIINCSNTVNIESEGHNMGGIAGSSYDTTSIINSCNTGDVINICDETTGGVIGSASEVTFINCYSSGKIRNASVPDSSSRAYNWGGFAGWYDKTDCKFTNCYFNNEDNIRGQGVDDRDSSNYTGMSLSEMKAASFVTTLNANAYLYNAGSPALTACAWVASTTPKLDAKKAPSAPSGIDIANSGSTYVIFTAKGFIKFADLVNGKAQTSINGKLAANITLSGDWTPIGSMKQPYTGTFDGGGYKVSRLKINDTNDAGAAPNDQGLFGYISGATIKNLSVAGSVYSKYGNGIGGLVGTVTNGSTIINCRNQATVTSSITSGGLAGSCEESNIINSCNTAIIKTVDNGTGMPMYSGGIVGQALHTQIIICYNAAEITGGTCGAIAGSVDYSSATSSCYYNSSNMSQGCGQNNTSDFNTDITAKSEDEMKAATFVELLNTGTEKYNNTNPATIACGWKTVSNGFPTLSW